MASLVVMAAEVKKSDTRRDTAVAAGGGAALGAAGTYAVRHPVAAARSTAASVLQRTDDAMGGVRRLAGRNVESDFLRGVRNNKIAGASGRKYKKMPKPPRQRLVGAAAGAAAGMGLVELHRRAQRDA